VGFNSGHDWQAGHSARLRDLKMLHSLRRGGERSEKRENQSGAENPSADFKRISAITVSPLRGATVHTLRKESHETPRAAFPILPFSNLGLAFTRQRKRIAPAGEDKRRSFPRYFFTQPVILNDMRRMKKQFPPALNRGEEGQVRTIVLLVIAVIVVAGGACHKKEVAPAQEIVDQQKDFVLSDSTKAVLKKLHSPIEIKFYAMLDSVYTPEPVKNFSVRAGQMLSAFEKEADGKLTAKRLVTNSTADASAATRDGLKPLDLEKGDPSFLGFVVTCRDKNETLPLSPEWEPAMEADLARAIARVSAIETQPTPVIEDPKIAEQITNDLRRVIPDPNSTSLADGIRLLRESALKELTTASAEMKKQLDAAQQKLSEAPEAQKSAALKHVQEVQLEQGEKLKEIASRLDAQIRMFEQLKTGSAK
jgi:hypothetical protein